MTPEQNLNLLTKTGFYEKFNDNSKSKYTIEINITINYRQLTTDKKYNKKS